MKNILSILSLCFVMLAFVTPQVGHSAFVNLNNAVANVGAVSSTTEVMVLEAAQTLLIKSIKMVDATVIGASGTNFIQLQVLLDGVLQQSLVDTQAGLAARAPIPLDIGSSGLLVTKGSVVSVAITVQGTGSLSRGSLMMNYLLIGN